MLFPSWRQWLRRALFGTRPTPPAARRPRTGLRLEALESRYAPAVFTVLNTLDSGVGSLRQAILGVNASGDTTNNIQFTIPGVGAQTINLLSPLPTITKQVILDATTQPGFSGTPLVQVSGGGTVAGNALTVAASGVTIRGLAINGFNGFAIAVASGNGTTIAGDYFGLTPAGAASPSPDVGGVFLGGSSTNSVVGGTNPGDRNVIGGTTYGIIGAATAGNTIEGNSIGTDVAGSAAMKNTYGIYLVGGSNNQIGGAATGAGNLISGNLLGVYATNESNLTIQGNLIGTNAAGSAGLGQTGGVLLLNPTNAVFGGTAAGTGNLLSGNMSYGLAIAGGNAVGIQGNLIGTDKGGTAALGDGAGVVLSNVTNALIGGTAAGSGNVISGNANYGVYATQSGGLHVQANFVGTDASGSKAVPNGTGLFITQSVGPLVGGTAAGVGNVLSGNSLGLNLTSDAGAVVQGNFIGTDPAGTVVIPNTTGVLVAVSTGTMIGGPSGTGTPTNIISGNSTFGVLISSSVSTTVQGNNIGTDVTGAVALANQYGVYDYFSAGTQIGGSAAGAGNVISGNSVGVYLNTSGQTKIQQNNIGTTVTGTTSLPNVIGIAMLNVNTVLIGGSGAGVANTIAFNTNWGVYLFSGINVTLTGNVIHDNPLGNITQT
jgi:parallel beta-helix repeat protein